MMLASDAELLLDLAIASIEAGIACGARVPLPAAAGAREALEAHRSSFVTVRVDARLRGCCGTLEAQRPLAADVWLNAWQAAFADARFAPLSRAEWHAADVGISVLSPLEPLPVASEVELLEQLRPGIDGIVLNLDRVQATFLPAVWQQLPEPAQFLGHLKHKAGLPKQFWSPRIRVHRYTAHCIGPRQFADWCAASRH
jgi:AmmeMemoRadiSam system protein A